MGDSLHNKLADIDARTLVDLSTYADSSILNLYS
jgi:hypothetical protein